MAHSSTIDNQKVFKSATENFKSFVGSVENVSHTKHMEEVYANMTKLFDAFTNGALLKQGANSETLLRTVYRSLNDDFLEIVQDTKAVDKLIEIIKSKQEGIEPEKVDEALVSETTKKVVTKTLDPDTCDPMQVVLDFIDELQTSILQVKLNLSREYERRRLEYAKSLAGQQEDLDKLKAESSQQTTEISETLGQVAEDETKWKDEHLNELSKLMEKFDQATGNASKNILAQTLMEDKNLTQAAKEPKKINWDKLVAGVKGQLKAVEELKSKEPPKAETKNQTPETKGQKNIQTSDEQSKPTKQEKSPIQAEGKVPSKKEDEGKKENGESKNVESKKDATKETPKDQQKEQKKEEEKDSEEKPKEKPPEAKLPKDDLSPLVPKVSKAGVEATKAGKLKIQPPTPKGTKLNVQPSKNGMHACPICGYVHAPGGPHGGQQPVQAPQPTAPSSDDGKISQNGILNTIGKVHENVQKQLNNKKFRNGFTMDFNKIQGGLQKQMKKIDNTEASISKDLDKTKSGIKQLKKPKGPGLLGLLMGGIAPIAFTIIGGLILITLARLAMKKWADTYMPKPDGSKMSIFGIPIPGWDTIKAFAIGIRNFVMVGLPNYWDRLKRFMGNIRKSLFDKKKGILRDMAAAKNALRRIIAAWIIGNTKKVGGKIASLVLKVVGWAFCWIPGVQPVCNLLAYIGPLIWSFVANKIMKMWSEGYADAERGAAEDIASQKSGTRGMVKQFRIALHGAASSIHTFKGQDMAIPGLETSRGADGELPRKGAIMRKMTMNYGKNAKRATKIQTSQVKEEVEKRKDQQDLAKSEMMSEKRGSVMGDLARDHTLSGVGQGAGYMQLWEQDANLRKKYRGDEDAYKRDIRAQAVQKFLTGKALGGQIKMLDQYIAQLSKSTRFKNVTGPLYHPDGGWNPGYRVFAKDLMSPIPLKPFEAIHDRADVPIGEPAEAETASIGFMPFKWFQDGVEIVANPIGYELERAKAIRKLYVWAAEQAGETMFNTYGWFSGTSGQSSAMADFNKILQKKGGKSWIEWNKVMPSRSLFDWEHKDKVVYGDKFRKFLTDFRDNKLTDADNDGEVILGNKKKSMSGEDKAALIGAAAAGTVGGGLGMIAGNVAGRMAYRVGGRAISDVQRTMNYDKGPDPTLAQRLNAKNPIVKRRAEAELRLRKARGEDISKIEEEAEQLKNKSPDNALVRAYKNINRKMSVAKRMSMQRKVKFFDMEYGTIRDLMFDGGLFDLLGKGMIMNTVKSTVPILEWMIKHDLFPGKVGFFGGVDNALNDLIFNFMKFAGIEGYDWSKVKTDRPTQAAFAQVFLEYLKFIFLPAWNKAERLLSRDISNQTDETDLKLRKHLWKLHRMLLPKSIFAFMQEHLRFPNMSIKVIDYSNAGKEDRKKLDEYRKQLGILDGSGKNTMLEGLKKIWTQIQEMPDAELKKQADLLRGTMAKAEFEAKYTGDYVFLNQLKKYWSAIKNQMKIRAESSSQPQGKIVKSAGDIQTKVIEPPPKSMQEIEEEKRKQEAEEAKRKAEQEAKEKAEREKKLQEEAKRKEALVAAQAKIKAMEAIREQEEKYETILQKMISDPGKVTDKELRSLKDEVTNLKQEAENQIAKLPREERELKLALIRGDKISEKTFTEIKETAIGLHGNLQEYIEEVNKIPVGSVLAIENAPGGNAPQPVKMQDSDSVDLGDS